MKWMLVIMFMTPGGDLLFRSYTETSSLEACELQRKRLLENPHPFGLKVEIDCKRLAIQAE